MCDVLLALDVRALTDATRSCEKKIEKNEFFINFLLLHVLTQE